MKFRNMWHLWKNLKENSSANQYPQNDMFTTHLVLKKCSFARIQPARNLLGALTHGAGIERSRGAKPQTRCQQQGFGTLSIVTLSTCLKQIQFHVLYDLHDIKQIVWDSSKQKISQTHFLTRFVSKNFLPAVRLRSSRSVWAAGIANTSDAPWSRLKESLAFGSRTKLCKALQ